MEAWHGNRAGHRKAALKGHQRRKGKRHAGRMKRDSKGRFIKRSKGKRKAYKKKKKSGAREAWHGNRSAHAKAARLGWQRRKRGRKGKGKVGKRSSGRGPKRNKKGQFTRGRSGKSSHRKKKRRAPAKMHGTHGATIEHETHYGPERPPASERRRGRRKNPSRYRRHSSHATLENPLEGKGEYVGHFFSALAGFMVGDIVDRFATTHSLQDSGQKDSTGNVIYSDPRGPTGSPYEGLYNPTAIAAPMWASPMRMLVAGGVLLLFWGGAGLAKGPGLKTGLTIAGYGAGVRIFGKMAIDGLAAMTMTSPMGQQLFDGEMRANLLQTVKGGTLPTTGPQLPSAGLGRRAPIRALGAPQKAGCGGCGPGNPCPGCGGHGAAGHGAPHSHHGVGYPARGVGAAWPSLPREVATANTVPPPPTAVPPQQVNLPPVPATAPPVPPPPPPPPRAAITETLRGSPYGMAAPPQPKFNPFTWGYPDEGGD